MKYVVLLLLLCIPQIVLAAEFHRDIPQESTNGEQITVTINIATTPNERTVLGEFLPEGSKFVSWSLEGAVAEEFVREDTSLVWDFTPVKEQVTVVYSVLLPQEGASATFDAVYAFAPSSHGNLKSTIQLTPPAPANFALPAPVPTTVPETNGSWMYVVFIIAVVALILVYMRKRIDEYSPHHRSFVDGMKHVSYKTNKFVRLHLARHAPDLIKNHPHSHREIERLKRELLDITFKMD